jgi:ADP-heptose:LPS heptosyltransferase
VRFVDLHRTLRSRLLGWRLALGGMAAELSSSYDKPRWKFWGYSLLRGLWPVGLRPEPVVRRFARAAGGTGQERPSLRHLVEGQKLPEGAPAAGTRTLCVMPGAAWKGKRWAPEKFLQVLRQESARWQAIVILGGASDQASRELVELARLDSLPVTDGVGRWSLPELARVLAQAKAYLGCDTGLAHLAEAVGTPALVVYGPTRPELGFGPWRPESRSVYADVACSPCGRDGRVCQRVWEPRACLHRLTPTVVATRLRELEGAGRD